MRTAVAAFAVALVLSGCGGGGGSSGGGAVVTSGGPAIEVPLTSFSAIAPNQTVVMDGIAVTASGTQVIQSDGTYTISSANLNPAGGGTVRLSYDGNRMLKTI